MATPKGMTFTENDATVTYTKERNEVQIVMPFAGARDDRIVVTARGEAGMDPQIVFDTAVRDVLQAAAWVSSGSKADDAGNPVLPDSDRDSEWHKKFAAAQSAVRIGQVGRPYAQGQMTFGEAIDRLTQDGVDPADAVKHMTAMKAAAERAAARKDDN